jgi:hypothetical protein
MRKRSAIWLGVGLSLLGALVPLGRLLARGGEPVDMNEPYAVPTGGAVLTATIPMSDPPTPKKPAIPSVMVNNRRIRLNYGISDVGPSGISAVELWATRDGRTWQRYSNEPPPAGPLVVHVAEEGRYGFYLVVKNGVGLTSPSPKTGDLPQLWVEVDETAPTVRLQEINVHKGSKGSLRITWSATDPNLMCRPITLSMATSNTGPWTPIATNLENTGEYVWQMTKEVPYQFYIRVEATDRAGNVGVSCTHEPIKVDLVRPHGTILGVDVDQRPVTKSSEMSDSNVSVRSVIPGEPVPAVATPEIAPKSPFLLGHTR